MPKKGVDTAYICMRKDNFPLYTNTDDLDPVLSYLQITQDNIYRNQLGRISNFQFGKWTFHFLNTDSYFFIAGTHNIERIPFLSLHVAVLEHVILLLLGPNPDYSR